MDPINLSLLTILATIIIYAFYRAWKVNQHWKERGIPHVKPWLFVGNTLPIVLMRKSFAGALQELCSVFPNEPIVGVYQFMKPAIMVNSPEMIEKILIKDFVYFMDRGMNIDEDRNPLESSLFTLSGKRWKAVRNKLSPIFTTGKLKMMFDSMIGCGGELVEQLGKGEEVDMRDYLGRFAVDVVGSSAFGIEPAQLSKPNSEFVRMAKRATEVDAVQLLKFLIMTNFPSFFKKFNIKFNKEDVLTYFGKIVDDTVKYRRENNYVRNDFVQLMMQLQDKGYVEVHTKDAADDYLNIDNNSYTTEKFELSNQQLTGQALVFFTAGFEPASLTMNYALYELSKHPEIQEKVRDEIQRETEEAGALTYDAIKEMHYLEQCIKETLRMYPPAPIMGRVCTKEYTLPNGVELKPNDFVMISLSALHYNPAYYPEPEKFKPKRFDPDRTYPPCCYLPFGAGPRICIAMRFAMLEMKYCLAKLLLNYKFEISPKTKEPLTLNIRSMFTSPNEKIYFIATKIA